MTWHIVTGEYPPAPGGVSDYTRAIAAGLAEAGDAVHVWCPATEGEAPSNAGVTVHPIAGEWAAEDLERLDAELSAIPGKRLLVQWVPHAYGKRSLNVAFCRWIARRARAGDHLELMVHEPGLGFGEGSLKHDFAAGVHRLMLTLLLRHARRAWVAIPAWTDVLRSWAFGSKAAFAWLPVPSTIPVADQPEDVGRLRSRLLHGPDSLVVGHFGTYPPDIRETLVGRVPSLLAANPRAHVQLLGRGGVELLDQLAQSAGGQAHRITAPGDLDASALSVHLQACDLMVQPYGDGASTRRTTLMAALAHGLPVVTTVGRLSEGFWREAAAVETVAAGDADALMQAVTRLLDAPERRRQMAVSARSLYDVRFSMPCVIGALRSAADVAA